MKKNFSLDRDGYVVNYLVSGPRIEKFDAPYALHDQLEFERQMRDIYYKAPSAKPSRASLGEISSIGSPWRYYASNRNPYVDFSIFYFTLQRVDFLVNTVLVSDKARAVRARVWSYAAFDMWCAGKHIATEKVPVYQPIRYTDVELSLSEGENDIFFAVQNFGVRDTRNMISFQLLDTEGISVTLPIEEDVLAQISSADEWFVGLRVEDGALVAPFVADFTAEVRVDGGEATNFNGVERLDLGDGFAIVATAEVAGQTFLRRFERYAMCSPNYESRGGKEALQLNFEKVLKKTNYHNLSPDEFEILGNDAATVCLCNIASNGGKLTEQDLTAIDYSVKCVRERRDCADFTLAVLLRLVYQLELPKEIYEKIKSAALDFRYWMDEEGADAMCFWSENHALTFFGCQYMAGELFPDDFFHRSGRTGLEQREVALRRIREWFDVIECEGFEEFCAGGYMGVTIAALSVVHDFCGEEIRARAAKVIDRIANEAAIQCFDGIHLSPMGRIYRTSITPYKSSLQALLYYLDDTNAQYFFSRFSHLAFSEYLFPTGLESVMHGNLDTVFNSGRAEIHTRKRKNYMLTSVASPRKTTPPSVKDESTEYFATKVMNEGFHGTSLFTPGGGGYQQHLWYAAISNKFYTFVTLPGTERDFCGMRPGYWYGNLIFPSLMQTERELFCHYSIPDSVPTKFTHAYFPAYFADELVVRDGFRFARVGDGYLALWCSEPLVTWNADAVVDADLRAYGDDVAWYVRVGSADEDGSFEDFVSATLSSGITYDKVVSKFGK